MAGQPENSNGGVFDTEQIAALEVGNAYDLGKLVAWRFVEWCVDHPRGVVSLPTGAMGQVLYKNLERMQKHWATELQTLTLDDDSIHIKSLPDFPNTRNLTLVMSYEFFPMNPSDSNSCCTSIRQSFVKLLKIKRDNLLSFDLIEENVLTADQLASIENDDAIDISLLQKDNDGDSLSPTDQETKEILTLVQEYCEDYEERISSLGGIGFFVSGIGPEGHLALNPSGSSLTSTCRLVSFDYSIAASLASDLGGIEKARGKASMTIGLGTILKKDEATILLLAAGEGKAKIVQEALELPQDASRPASAFYGHKGARMYMTRGAASLLTERNLLKMAAVSEDVCVDWAGMHVLHVDSMTETNFVNPPKDYTLIESLLYDTSLRMEVPVSELTISHLNSILKGKSIPAWLRDPETLEDLKKCAIQRLEEKVEGGLRAMSGQSKTILHTAPHHDDIMLSYHGAMHAMLGRPLPGANTSGRKRPLGVDSELGEEFNDNTNHFAYLTSGFNSVPDDFLENWVDAMSGANDSYRFVSSAVSSGDLNKTYDAIMTEFRIAFSSGDLKAQERIEKVIFLRKVAEVFDVDVACSKNTLIEELKAKIESVRSDYLESSDSCEDTAITKCAKMLKGCMRESEVDRVWALSSVPNERLHHLRSKFYMEKKTPTTADDAMPVANLIRRLRPDMLTVALDPEGTGPDTHYKVLQIVADGIRVSLERGDLRDNKLLVWGYRNVWFVFSPSDATLLMPVSESDLNLMHDTFMACFTTQKDASFPSPLYDGPFSAWSRHLQKVQKKDLAVLLGEKYFQDHPDPRVQAAAGFVFIKAMPVDQFLQEVQGLKSKIEA
jgi:glucosamine-6-phosphate deaminase